VRASQDDPSNGRSQHETLHADRSNASEIRAAAREYAEEVRQSRFPAAEHTYSR
jgi:ketopantoate hydroxymethyltransferase